MRRLGIVTTALLLCAFLGGTAVGYAQERQADKRAKPDRQARGEKQKPQQQPQQRPEQRPQSPQQRSPQQPQQRGQQRPEQHPQQMQRPQQAARFAQPQSQMRRTPEQRGSQQLEQRSIWRQRRARDFRSEHRSWRERGGYDGYRIPDIYYTSYYGPTHWFRLFGLPFLVAGGYPRFQYHGYWFNVVEPYPEYWGVRWYETDDVYVDYSGDGYYLFNRRYPNRPGVAITIVF